MATTTFVHIGDFHAGPGPRNADRYRALDQIIREGEAIATLAAWLWPGDLNHGRMTIEDRNALAARLARMAACAPVVICYGNHDLPGDLDVFAKLKSKYPIAVVDTPRVLTIEVATKQGVRTAAIFVLPYPQKAGLTAMGVTPGDVIPTAADALDAIFMQAAADLVDASARGHLTLMIGHVNVAGSITSAGQPNIGREIEIGPQQLDRLGPIYKGLNHIHVAQELHGALYAGSVCRLSWGEIEAKSYLEVVFDNDIAEPGAWDYLRRTIDVAPMYHVEGELTRDSFTWLVKDGPGGGVQPAPASWKGCEVRCRYKFKASEKSVLAEARVLAEFAEAARLDIEPIAQADRTPRDGATEVLAARTLEQKLAAYAHVETLAPGVADKLAQLQRPDLLAVLSDLQTALASLEQSEPAEVAA